MQKSETTYRFKNGAALSNVTAGRNSEAADETGAQVTKSGHSSH